MKSLSELCDSFFSRKIDKPEDDINCLKRAMHKFCETGKKEDAFSVYFCFCEIFKVFGSGYGTMSKLLEFLSDHEYHSGELLEKHRDHYSHSVYVFALGLAIYTKSPVFENIINSFYKQNDFDDTQFLYLWGLVALFHDIGYPFQLAYDQIKSYAKELWGESENNPYVSYNNMERLLQLSPKAMAECHYFGIKNVNELLAYGIHDRLDYPLHVLLRALVKKYADQPKFMDHGYFSAVLLTHRLTESCVKLDAQIIDVLTAIALHNSLNKHDIKDALKDLLESNDKQLHKDTDPAKIERKVKKTVIIAPEKHPLAYLLVLCDELQNWDRVAFGYISKKDPLAWKIDLKITKEFIQIDYIFDSLSVLNLDEESGFDEEKKNKNVEKIQSGAFLAGIQDLVKCHTKIKVNVIEMKKDKKVKIFASSDSFINLCDFATAIHESYQKTFGGPNFDNLSLEFKLSNIEQAKSYADKLELVNCFYSDKELDFPVVKGFTSKNDDSNDLGKRDDLSFLAREEHLRWVREKLDNGWTYGTDYTTREERDNKKIHRDIIPYDCLPEEEQKKDELMIQNMVPLLYKHGHGVRIYNYRTGTKPVLDVAGCGHMTISMDDKTLKERIKKILRGYQKHYRVIVRTCFAMGADQLIAQCANELGITIKATIPFKYEDYITHIRENAKRYGYKFTKKDETNMRHLLAQVVSLKVKSDPEFLYLEASKYILNRSTKLIAIWDGVETLLKDSKGRPINQGGTWHSIYMARNSRGLTDDDIHIIKCER